HVVPLPHDAMDNRKNLGLVPLHDVAESRLIAGLSPPDQNSFLGILIVHSVSSLRPSNGREWKGSGQCSHTPLPTRAAPRWFQPYPNAIPLAELHLQRYQIPATGLLDRHLTIWVSVPIFV